MPGVGEFITTVVLQVLFAAGVDVAILATIQTGLTFAINTALSIGLSTLAAKAMMPSSADMSSQLDTGLSAMSTKKIAYGHTRIGGDVIFMSTSRRYSGDYGGYEGGDGEEWLLHMVVEVAGHPCKSFTNPLTDVDVYIGDEQLNVVAATNARHSIDLYPDAKGTDNAGKQRYLVDNESYTRGSGNKKDSLLMLKFYNGTQTAADQDLIDMSAFSGDDWTINHIGYGKTYVAARLQHDPEAFQGVPKFTFEGDWKNDVYDPRTSTSGFTANSALCTADYMVTPREEGGLGADWADLEEDVLKASANTCDENVAIFEDATTQKRYFMGGRIDTNNTPQSILEQMLNTMAGWTEKINGKWHIQAGAYSAPEMTLTESDLLDFPTVKLNRGFRDIYNSVRVGVRSAESEWQPAMAQSVEANTLIDVTADNTANDFTTVSAHGLVNGDRVRFNSWSGSAWNQANIPSGLDPAKWYYVVNKTTLTFQVSETKGGAVKTFTTNGTGTITAIFDNYLSRDLKRKTADINFALLNDQTLGRRLGAIDLISSRMEVSASLKCRLGYAPSTVDTIHQTCAFDLALGDSVRWVDRDKSFWELTGSSTSDVPVAVNGTFTLNAHGFLNGQPLVITDADISGFRQNYPFYVINATANTFQLADYRGGQALTATATQVELQPVRGKLFRVMGYNPVLEEGFPHVNIELLETTSDLYTWQSGRELAPATKEAVSVQSPRVVASPTNLAAASGDSELYIKQDGTVGSRVKLTWDPANDEFTRGGKIEVQYRPYESWSAAPGDINAGNDLITLPNHGLVDNDILELSGTLPTSTPQVVTTESYAVIVDSVNGILLATHKNAATEIDITAAGASNLILSAPERGWIDVPDAPSGSATRFYISDLEDNQAYDFRIRFRNSLGFVGPWAVVSNHTFVGKSAAPAVPTSPSFKPISKFAVGFYWTNPADLDLSHVELLWSSGMFAAMHSSSTDKVTTYAWDRQTGNWTATAHGFSNGDIVYVDPRHWDTSLSPDRWAEGLLDPALSQNTPYYVVNAGTNDFQLSLTSGGAAIDITDMTSSSDPWFSVIKYVTPTAIGKSPPKADAMVFEFEVPNDVAWFWLRAVDKSENESDIISVGPAHAQFVNVANAPNWSTIDTDGQQLTAYFRDGDEPRSLFTEDHKTGDTLMVYTVDGQAFSEAQYKSISGAYVIFKRQSTQPSVPTGTGIPTGWSLTPPSGTARLWAVQGNASATPDAYSSPVLEVVNSKGETPTW